MKSNNNPLAGKLAQVIWQHRALLNEKDSLGVLAGIIKRELRRHKVEIAVHVEGGIVTDVVAHNLGQKSRLFVVDHDGIGSVFNYDDVNIETRHEIETETENYFLSLGIAAELGLPEQQQQREIAT